MTSPQRVLVVDDDPSVREGIRDALAEAEIHCEQAATGAEALKAAEDPRIACMLLGVRLADRSGVAVLEDVRAEHPALRVVVLASPGDQELVLEALRAGASDYLARPVHEEELRLSVRRALDAHGVELRLASLQERLAGLAEHVEALARAVHQGLPQAELGGRIATALAEVLGAERAVWLRVAPDDTLRLEAAHGCGSASDDAAPASPDESVAGLALVEGRALHIEDVETDPRCVACVWRPPFRGPSLLLAPVEVGEACVGVLCVGDRIRPGSFSDEDLALLRVFAQQAALWLAPERTAPAAETPAPAAAPEEDPSSELLRSVCDAMTREIEPERLLAAALRPVARAAAARVVSVHLIDNETGVLRREAQCEGSDSDRAELPRERGLTGGSLQSGMLVAAEHPERDARFDPEVDTPESGRAGPLLVIPLRVRERILGVARLFPAAGEGAPARLGELLGAPLSAAVRNVLLYRSLLDSVEDVARARREAEGRS